MANENIINLPSTTSFAETFLDDDTPKEARETIQSAREFCVNVKDYAVGDGVIDDSENLASAAEEAGNNTLLFPAGTYYIGSSITFDYTTTLIFMRGALLKLKDENVTIQGGVSAGNYKIFELSGTGLAKVSNQKINTVWYSSSGAGSSSSPWVDALRNALAANGAGHQYHLPTGHYEDQSTVTISDDSVIITGDGQRQTLVHYQQADGSPCWQIVDSGNTIFTSRISRIKFDGESIATGGAIYIEDLSDGLIEEVFIDNYDAVATNYGIKIAGRDGITIRKCYINAKRCIWLTNNPNHATLDVDHFDFQDLVLGPGDYINGYGYYVDADNIFDFVTSGTIAICDCLYGFWWQNSATSTSEHIVLRNFGIEGVGASGWGIYFNPNDDVTNVLVENCSMGGLGNGVYFRNAHNLTFINPMLIAASGKIAVDIDAEGKPVLFLGGFWTSAETWNMGASDKLICTTAETTDDYIGMRLYGGRNLLEMQRALLRKYVTITYSASMTPDLREGNIFYIEVTDGVAFTINQPTTDGGGIGSGEDFFIVIENSSGGVCGNITWQSRYKFDGGVAPTKPANGKAIVAHFVRAAPYAFACSSFGDDYSI